MWPGLEDVPAKEAGIAGLLTGLLAWGLRWVLRARADLRADRAGERDDDAGERSQEVWERTVAHQQAQIDRLVEDAKTLLARIDQLTQMVNTEREMRYAAEGQSRRDGWRIQVLEDELTRLRGAPLPVKPQG